MTFAPPLPNRRFGRTTTIGSATLAVALLVSCSTTEESSAEGDSDTQTAEVQRFYDQELQFGDCSGYATTAADEAAITGRADAECARLEVPLDYNDPEGRTGEIAVLKVPARGEKIGSLLLKPGGPGGPGMAMAAAAATNWADSPITERFDLIGFDPQGVAASTPAIDCFTDADIDAGDGETSRTVGYGSLTEQDTRAILDRCATGSGGEDVLASVGTRNAVRDMDVLRAAVGDEKLTFLGQSYGTRLGAVYAEMFPQNVRALVLDGAIDPLLGTTERRLIQWEGFQRSFTEMAGFCAEQPDCPLGTDPARAGEAFQALARPLIDNPIVDDRGAFGFNEAYGTVVSGLYYEQVWPVIVDGLRELRDGRSETLQSIGDAFSGRGADGR